MKRKPTIFRDGNQVIYGIELARLDVERFGNAISRNAPRTWKAAALGLLVMALIEGVIAWAAMTGRI